MLLARARTPGDAWRRSYEATELQASKRRWEPFEATRSEAVSRLTKPFLVTALLASIPAVPEVVAKPRQQQQDAVESLAIEKGKCTTLVTLSENKSSICNDKLLNTTWKSGRAGFYFVTTDGEAVTFSGIGDGQIHPNPDVAIQPVDRVIFGKSHELLKAVGMCRFTNPFHGRATVDCEATTEVGPFKGSFESDGSEPDIKRF